jgi:hypothetical protein
MSRYVEDATVFVEEKRKIQTIRQAKGWSDQQLLTLFLGFIDDRGLTEHLKYWIEDASNESS